MDCRDEVGRAGAIARHKDDEIGVEAVPDSGCLGDQVVAGLDEELQLPAGVGQPDRWQLGLAERHPGDRQGIAGIALAGPARP
jgi:hypothetical protein